MTWKYIDLLNENIRILLTIALGILLGRLKVFDAKTFVPQSVRFVFHVALPCLVVRGIGIGTDFYSDKNLWSYIGIFLILRAIALVAAFVCVALLHTKSDGRRAAGIGQVAVIWLSLTWISTVILGIPISAAVFGNAEKGAMYGLFAGVSSFIFQLPVQLLFLECHVLEKQMLVSGTSKTADVEAPSIVESPLDEVHLPSEIQQEENPREEGEEKEEIVDDTRPPLVLWLQFARRRDVWVKILKRVLRNPVLWGIACGFILSLSTIGPTYLHPLKPDFYKPMGWIWYTTEWLGECVSPVSLFAMGIWMAGQGKKLVRISLKEAVLYMLSKLIIVPLIVLGLAKAVNLEDEPGRAAVLIAALPISLASFSLGSQYEIGEKILSANVTLGTILLLPTILLWNLVLDKVGLFPIALKLAGT